MRQNTNVEYRTTKEILEGIARKASLYSDFTFRTIFNDDKMFLCLKPKTGNTIFEIKFTKKVRAEGIRMVANGVWGNKDKEKEAYLSAFKTIAECVFKKVYSHDGKILISDDNNDYVITLVKKTGLVWPNA